jgi:hypothetical protein
MKTKIRFLAILAILGISSFNASSQNTEVDTRQKGRHEFMVEVDPLPFIMGGVGGHFGWSPKKSEHFTFGLAIISQVEYPKALIESSSQNKKIGWGLK